MNTNRIIEAKLVGAIATQASTFDTLNKQIEQLMRLRDNMRRDIAESVNSYIEVLPIIEPDETCHAQMTEEIKKKANSMSGVKIF